MVLLFLWDAWLSALKTTDDFDQKHGIGSFDLKASEFSSVFEKTGFVNINVDLFHCSTLLCNIYGVVYNFQN